MTYYPMNTSKKYNDEQISRAGHSHTTTGTKALIYNGYNNNGNVVDSSPENIIAEVSLLNVHGYPIDTSDSTGQNYLNAIHINRLVHPNGAFYESNDDFDNNYGYGNIGGNISSGAKLHFMIELKNNSKILLTGLEIMPGMLILSRK